MRRLLVRTMDCNPMHELYYIQSRGFCGDCLLWWRDGGHGYTTDLNQAWKVTREQAEGICSSRVEDTAWLVADIDSVAVRHADSERMQGKKPAIIGRQ